MFLLGLTGSIGMGKSTTAKLFVEEGCELWDADAAVHRLYSKDGAAIFFFRDAFPTSIVDGEVSRSKLKEIIAQDTTALQRIEEIVHPLVGEDRAGFIENASSDIVVLDIPLLFETGGEAKVDAVVCVITDEETQKTRVLERGTMTEAQLEVIRAKQLPAAEKAARADYVITTDTIEDTRLQVQNVIRDIREKLRYA